MANRNIIHRYDNHISDRGMKENIKIVLQKRIYEFFSPSIENIMDSFAIVEKLRITQEKCEELLKILNEWEV